MSRNITVTLEDGSTHQYANVPDSVTPEQVEARAQQDTGKKVVSIDGGRAQQATTEEKPVGSMDTGDITSGYLMGLKDPITGGAQLLPKGLEYLSSAGGYAPNVISQFFGEEARRMTALAREEEQKYQASRGGEEGFDLARLGGNVVNPANLALAARAPVVAGAAAGALQPVLGPEEDFWTAKATQAGLGAAGGFVGGKTAEIAGKVLNPLTTKAEQTMRDLGVKLTPGQYMSRQSKALEEYASNLPLVGKYISNARERQLFQFNKGVINKALRKVDEKLPEDVVGRDAVQYVQNVINAKYDDVLSKVSLNYDRGVAVKIGSVIGKSKVVGAAKKQELNDVLNTVIYSQIPVSKKVTGKVSGDMFKRIETDLNNKILSYSKSIDPKDADVAEALKEALKIWRSELASQNPKQALQLSKVNAAFSDVSVMETAAGLSQTTNGVFTPRQYQSAVRQRDVTRRKRAFAAGRAKGQEVSDAAVELLSPEANIAMEGRMATNIVGGVAAVKSPLGGLTTLGIVPSLYSKTGLEILEKVVSQRPEVVRKLGAVLQKNATAGSITAAEVLEALGKE